MNDEAIYKGKLPTADFISDEIARENPCANDEQRTRKLFYWLAGAQIPQIAGGLILGLLVAPASLFVSRNETEAFWWIAAAFAGFAAAALGLILIALSMTSAFAFRHAKSWRRFVGTSTAILAIFAFPCGTIGGALLLCKLFKRN